MYIVAQQYADMQVVTCGGCCWMYYAGEPVVRKVSVDCWCVRHAGFSMRICPKFALKIFLCFYTQLMHSKSSKIILLNPYTTFSDI